MNLYPNQTMLQIIEGERGGAPVLPPVRPGDEHGPARRENILDILADAVRRRRIPDPATKKGQDVVNRIARAGLPPQLPPGGPENCLLPSPLGCLLSRDTATLIGVNVLLLVALIAGVLMIVGQPAKSAVLTVLGGSTGVTGAVSARNAMHAARSKRHAAAARLEGE